MLLYVFLYSAILFICQGENQCCSFPCQNGGVCMPKGDDYRCDCTGLKFYGKNCDTSSFMNRVGNWFRPSPETQQNLLTNNKWIWNIVNSISGVRGRVMKAVLLARTKVIDSPPRYNSDYDYVTLDAATNRSYYMRVLPPVPRNCPKPVGVAGPKVMPDAGLVVDTLFRRKEFKPDKTGTSMLLPFFAQHFTHMFFKTDFKRGPGFTWGGDGVDVSNIYGPNKQSENLLRSFKDGKLKSQIINNEEWPPLVSDAPVKMIYPKNTPEDQKFAVGHEFFGILPGLMTFATIWLREHNRVCDVLKKEQPDWDDERLFQTTKLIILGEVIKIVIEDYVNHLAGYHFKLEFNPEVLFDTKFQYSNRIAAEFNHMYHWHPLIPDKFNISGDIYPLKDLMYDNKKLVKTGMKGMVESLSRQRAGAITFRNQAESLLKVAEQNIKWGRQLRFQSFNQYRKLFNLEPYKSFKELTGEDEISAALQHFYKDVDAVEFYVGLIVEKHREKSMLPPTIIEFGAPFSLKGLMASPICSPQQWKPSTFGGDVGFNIIKTATLKKLFCQNIKGECPLVSFRVPGF